MRAAWPLLLLAVTACTGTDGKDTDTDAGGATWTSVHDDILTPSCGLAGCHAAPSANGMELGDAATSYGNIVDAESSFLAGEILAVPGDADGSYLIHKLEGASGIDGDAMPPPFGGQDPADILAIRDWIDAGAPEN